MSLKILENEIDIIFIIDVFDEKYRLQDRTSNRLRDIYTKFGCMVYVDFYKETKNIIDMFYNVKENCVGKNVILHLCGHSAKFGDQIVGISIFDKFILPFSKIQEILEEINQLTDSFILNLMAMCESTQLTQNIELRFPVFTSNQSQGLGVTDKLNLFYDKVSEIIPFLKVLEQLDSNKEYSYQNNG